MRRATLITEGSVSSHLEALGSSPSRFLRDAVGPIERGSLLDGRCGSHFHAQFLVEHLPADRRTPDLDRAHDNDRGHPLRGGPQ
jgi:hypothetical protein